MTNARALGRLCPLLLLLDAGCGATKGSASTASFTYDHGLVALSHPLAVGGTSFLYFTVKAGAGVASVVAAPSGFVSIGPLTVEGAGVLGVASVGGVAAGICTVAALDASGNELGTATIQVSSAASVSDDAQNGLTLLEGGQYAAQATAADSAGVVLEGTSFQVTYAGAIAPTEISWAYDSPIAFAAVSPGAGHATIGTPSASTSLAVQVVSASDLDSFSFSSDSLSLELHEGSEVGYTLTSGGTTVYSDGSELACTSSDPAVATPSKASSSGLGGGAQTGTLLVDAVASGSATITCRAGSLVASFDVTVPRDGGP